MEDPLLNLASSTATVQVTLFANSAAPRLAQRLAAAEGQGDHVPAVRCHSFEGRIEAVDEQGNIAVLVNGSNALRIVRGDQIKMIQTR